MEKIERLNLINQLLILEKLYPDDAEYYARNRKALEQGYVLHYSWLTEHVYDEFPIEESKFVLDVLEMYRSITFSYQRIHRDKQIPSNLKFIGFDGNNESEHMGYTQYFINELDRFTELKYDDALPYFNSHCPMIGKYKLMLVTWKKINSHDLTMQQIEQLLGL